MSTVLTERAGSFQQFNELFSKSDRFPYWPVNLAHIYLKLEFTQQFENASTADDAKKFLKSVARAAMAAESLVGVYDGFILEIQGSLIHLAIPQKDDQELRDITREYVGRLHSTLAGVFHNRKKRVQGWRVVVDAGKTLIVRGKGIHEDESFVSLGKSANRPAKYLYQQLSLTAENQQLRRFYMGVRNPNTGRWDVEDLNSLLTGITESYNFSAANFTDRDPELVFHSRASIAARGAIPTESVSNFSEAPTPEKPITYFGWVMRSDLDGFTSRVEECYDNDAQLLKLAEDFQEIMNKASEFSKRHSQSLAQLPWAGDNYTAMAVFESKEDYDLALPKQLVDLTLDFEKEMKDSATQSGFGGWAYGVAGGEVHGNANGNIYIAGIVLEKRRFLVGVGEGVGRSAQVFTDIAPNASEIVVYMDDYLKLHPEYKGKFTTPKNSQNQDSTLYRQTSISDLQIVRLSRATMGVATVLTTGGGGGVASVQTKPYFG